MTQPVHDAELRELLQLAKTTEQKAKELAELTLDLDQKHQKRLAEIRLARKLQL